MKSPGWLAIQQVRQMVDSDSAEGTYIPAEVHRFPLRLRQVQSLGNTLVYALTERKSRK